MRRSPVAVHPRFRLALGLLIAGVALAGCDVPGARNDRMRGGAPTCGVDADAQVGADVVTHLGTNGEAAVIISLVVPDADAVTSDERNAAIARAQERVLASVEESDYRNRVRYVTVPALAGTLYTCRGLEVLSKHPDVRRIDLDTGGGGG